MADDATGIGSGTSWATTPGVRNKMRLQPSENTAPERELRRELHSRGLRYRIHQNVLLGTRRKADIVFPAAKVAIYVDGCFWHGCPHHYVPPKANPDYWHPKIENNRTRDVDTDRSLAAMGWKVLRVWEHEDVRETADRVEVAVRGEGEQFP